MTNPSPLESAAIELHGLRHRYDTEEVLRGIDLSIPRGEVFGFVGHNGWGTSTTVNILTTLIKPTAGSARVCGNDVEREPMPVRQVIGYLPSDIRMYDHDGRDGMPRTA